MDQGEEAGTAALKRDPLDFALWKAQKEGEDTAWDSPWGEGRPGWHIECSAMAEKLLGIDFDVHGGGSDLVFPHHENEIAQSEGARGRRFARIWMHNGMLQLDREKMSKSVGNIFQLSEALDRFGAEKLIAYLVSGHYRKPVEFSEERVEQAAAAIERLRNFLLEPAPEGEPDPVAESAREAFLDELADDFNTPGALAKLHELVAEANRRPLPGARDVLVEALPLLGLESLLAGADRPDPAAEDLLRRREEARASRDFAAADSLRDELAELGWEVRDSAEGPRLVRRR